MFNLEAEIDALVKREGGYTNNPNDAGGATRWGITEAEARANGYVGRMEDLPIGVARGIYEKKYWRDPQFDKVAAIYPDIAAELFDTGVNMGQETAVRFLQRALNAMNKQGSLFPDQAVDGKVGGALLSALTSFKKVRGDEGGLVLLRALNCLQGARYIELCEKRPPNEDFIYGWIKNRVS